MPGGAGRKGWLRLRLRLQRLGPFPRERVQAEGHDRHGAPADPQQDAHSGAAGCTGSLQEDGPAAAWPVSRDGPHRLGQKHHAREPDQLHQRNPRSPHHHDRGSDRVLSQVEEVHGQPAGDRHRRDELLGGPPPRAATRPRHHPRRRASRPGDDRGGDLRR